VIIRVNPWPFNYSFKSYLVDDSQQTLYRGLSCKDLSDFYTISGIRQYALLTKKD